MKEKELAQSIYKNLKEKSKIPSFVSWVIKPQKLTEFDNYNITELKKQANNLGFNIFELNEIKSNIYKDEKGETIIASFYDLNDL